MEGNSYFGFEELFLLFSGRHMLNSVSKLIEFVKL